MNTRLDEIASRIYQVSSTFPKQTSCSASSWSTAMSHRCFTRGRDDCSRSFCRRSTRCTVGQSVGHPSRTVADISDPAHAPDATLHHIPEQRFCPDTEEVTGSNPVSDFP